MNDWYTVNNTDTVCSPALLFYPDRIERNIRRSIEIAGHPSKLRPHIKTHKCAEIVGMHLDAGITKFKCATVAEAEMAVTVGATDVLLAFQPCGPGVARYAVLETLFRSGATLSCLVDDESTIQKLAHANQPPHRPFRLLLDIDCGQGRTGVPAGPRAVELYKLICSDKRLVVGGLHTYDGHIHDTDVEARKKKCDDAFAPVEALRRELLAARMPVPAIVAGGTPTFPIHAKRDAELNIECSPGTHVLWDAGYSMNFPDLGFEVAAAVLTRVISKPGAKRLCLDLGHKAVASERPHPRVIFPELVGSSVIMHNEEHLVIEAENGGDYKVGDAVYGIPLHICPTVALHQEANIICDRTMIERWKIAARDRRIGI